MLACDPAYLIPRLTGNMDTKIIPCLSFLGAPGRVLHQLARKTVYGGVLGIKGTVVILMPVH